MVKNFFSFCHIFWIVATGFVYRSVVGDDVLCLKGLKQSVSDGAGNLRTWDFTNTTVGFICTFPGVSCWNDRENRVLSLRLAGLQLSGAISDSLQYCSSMTSLDLSSNGFSGPIPSKICSWLPYLVNLDLSQNQFSGMIPPELADCRFLNTLSLNDNQLSGAIPPQLSRLERMKKFSVANNNLSGSIPSSFAGFGPAWFSGNSKLCGRPLGSKCGGLGKTSLIIIISAGVFGACVSMLFGFFVRWWYFGRRSKGEACWC